MRDEASRVAQTLRHRVRWQLDDDLVPSQDAPTMARVFIYLYGLGATLTLATLPLAHLSASSDLQVLWSVAAAYAVTGLLLVRFDRLPRWAFLLMPPLGTVLVTNIVIAAGEGGLTAYSTIYFWVVLAAASFFGWRVTVINLLWIAACYGAALAVTPESGNVPLRMLLALGTLAVVALVLQALRARAERLVEQLRRRARKQRRVAELGERALAGVELTELCRMASEAVADAFDVEYAAVFEPTPVGTHLFKTGHGLRPQSLELPAQDPLIGAAFGSEEVIEHPRYGEYLIGQPDRTNRLEITSGVAVAIPGREQPIGVLAACAKGTLPMTQTDRSFLQSVAHVVGDAIERDRVAAEQEHRAMHDQLTGRPNRTLFTDRLNEALIRVQRQKELVGVFFLDIDDFKLVNDGFGHGAGDEMLRVFGPRLREALVMTDTVARFGGDEFAVVCEGISGEAEAAEIAERIARALERPFEIKGVPHRIGASIGVALSDGTEDAEDLIAHADAAMYWAKERARGSYEFFDQELRERVERRTAFDGALRAAADENDLRLVTQPIVSLPGGDPVSCEVLLRWDHPDLGAVSPAEFIPIAEETGAIVPLGDWVFAETCRLAARWRSDPITRRYLPLHVNVSARQLAQQDFVEGIQQAVAVTGARIRDLAFEITEHALLENAEDNVKLLQRLQEIGFSIILDDFGTGYSSLSHLKLFPIDVVKIDRLFVKNLLEAKQDQAIVSAVIGMADAFALDVVAEGIETREQAERLAELGCGFAQGYHFGRPTDPEHLAAPDATQPAIPS
jgi:diguanylate cyclase (GGDEF)-like protein